MPADDFGISQREQVARFSGMGHSPRAAQAPGIVVDGLVARSRNALPRPFDPVPGLKPTASRAPLPVPCVERLVRAGIAGCTDDDNPTQTERDGIDERLAIAGRVLSADGAGIAGVTLIATPIAASDSDRQRFAPDHTRYRTVSDANGVYFFTGLPDGNYTIRSNRHDNYPSVRISVSAGIEQADIVLRSEELSEAPPQR